MIMIKIKLWISVVQIEDYKYFKNIDIKIKMNKLRIKIILLIRLIKYLILKNKNQV